MRLGLIGKAIQQSRMPALQRLAAARTGQALDYALLDLESDDPARFDRTFDACRTEGYRGVNVTHPFKELAVRRVRIDDPLVRAIGAVNTVLFDEREEPRGFNTDHSGFLRAYRRRFGGRAPGKVGVIGTGGVGRAISFALMALGAAEIRLFDIEPAKARALADALAGIGSRSAIVTADSCEQAVSGADGIVNGTPIGMYCKPGCPVPADSIGEQQWVFDAIYTPMETELLALTAARGIETFSGFELFLGQGVDAFEAFTGVHLSDEDVVAIEREIRAGIVAA
jgi:quinate/shikimate dehydrogenase (NAD+)